MAHQPCFQQLVSEKKCLNKLHDTVHMLGTEQQSGKSFVNSMVSFIEHIAANNPNISLQRQ